jgi:hypothetical protein
LPETGQRGALDWHGFGRFGAFCAAVGQMLPGCWIHTLTEFQPDLESIRDKSKDKSKNLTHMDGEHIIFMCTPVGPLWAPWPPLGCDPTGFFVSFLSPHEGIQPSTMNLVTFLVDGFNLYHSVRSAGKLCASRQSGWISRDCVHLTCTLSRMQLTTKRDWLRSCQN